MKFLCDRCKTRYSIGDDRVRGKILKIRCKNCANVITVREGMTDVDASDPQGVRRNKAATQAVPLVGATGAKPNGGAGALGAAFASALTTKPPAALEEEWYVSIDGDQAGPFSLGEAQRWVGGKPFDADLHCWSEGFDDWLPVDKVSHFRGLRKPPAPPPALPRAAGRPVAPPHPRPQPRIEDEPKPLFAATMASLERSSPTTTASFGMPAAAAPPRPSATPRGGERAIPMAARANGAVTPMKVPAIAPMVPAKHEPAPRPSTKSGVAPVPAFDVGDAATQIDAAGFDDGAPTAASVGAGFPHDVFASASNAAETSPQMPRALDDAAATGLRLASDPAVNDDDEDDDDLQIGEVSRVVNLADLRPPTKPRSGPIARAGTGAVPRLGTGAVPRLGTGAVPRIDDVGLSGGDGQLELAAIPAPVASTHRRGLVVLISVAALVLIGVAIAVALLVFTDGDEGFGKLGKGNSIDTTRPDDPLRKRPVVADPTAGSAENPFFPTPKRPTPVRPNPPPVKDPIPTPGGERLGGEEIEVMARTHSTATQRCYMRSQKGVDAILIGDVKKILATLTIDPSGVVSSVSLDKHSTNTLGKCLISAIKSWRFRASPGGLYRLTLQFVSN